MLVLSLLASLTAAAHTPAAVVELPPPTNLRVEGLASNPVLSLERPAFSFMHMHGGDDSDQPGEADQQWVHPGAAARGLRQTAYRVAVWRVGIGDAGRDTLVWDSAKVGSSNCSVIVFGGDAPLTPFEMYRWQVQWWRSDGECSYSPTLYLILSSVPRWSTPGV